MFSRYSDIKKGRTNVLVILGGGSVSQTLLKDKAFPTFLDQNPPFELPEKGDFAFDKKPARPMVRHRQQCHQATSERQIAVAPLSLIAVSRGI
jgi:hypothetical protein